MEKSNIKNYYNSKTWVKNKINEYIYGNKRIDECIYFFERNIKPTTRSVIEIGCSIGLTTYALSKNFPNVSFTGIDIAQEQIDIANLFTKSDNIKFICTDITQNDDLESYDCITLFDVYEHIPINNRPEFNKALDRLLNDNGLLFITCPSWIITNYHRQFKTEKLQIVDEIVDLMDYKRLAKDINGEVVYMELISVWKKFDYCHCLITKEKTLELVKRDLKNGFIQKIRVKMGLDNHSIKFRKRRKIVKDLFGEI